ncbi:MAG: prolyl oligopeptidase family serine peptidase [Betaproteobacteria bacterium]|nr:prolyl oligopeptidase family serine peptidase [Betaproteobacteria bacterium]
MKLTRRQFNTIVAGLGAGVTVRPEAAKAQSNAQPTTSLATTPAAAHQATYFFKNSAFEYVLLTSLGRAYHRGGNVGKVLYVIRQIEDGNFESAYQALIAAGNEMRAIAEDSASGGHIESARQAYLWAQNFYDSATYFADGTGDHRRITTAWQMMDDCWLKSLALFDPPIEQVGIPYEGIALRGFYFRGKSSKKQRPLLILVNGSDGSALDMWMMGAAGAAPRGYDCLTFDGPGQGYALWKQGLTFRPDWERVVTPVVDFALARKGVDPKRIAIQGISQGGYWVPRALAFEKRIAAAIADPGVVDVSTSWTATLPPPMLELLKAGRKDEFDSYMTKMLDPATKNSLVFRMRPYGTTSYYDAFKATMTYNLTDVVGKIRCPMLITEPANEAFWPGQSQRLYDLLTCPKTLVPFSVSDGADLHCEPKGYGLRDLRVFNWLDKTLG